MHTKTEVGFVSTDFTTKWRQNERSDLKHLIFQTKFYDRIIKFAQLSYIVIIWNVKISKGCGAGGGGVKFWGVKMSNHPVALIIPLH